MSGEPWFTSGLVCPRDHLPLTFDGMALVSPLGRRYPVLDGIPVLLRPDVGANHGTTRRTWASVKEHERRGESACGGETNETRTARDAWSPESVHPFVQDALLSTHGTMYRRVSLKRYPIPTARLPRAQGEAWLLDVGCSWGRWSLAAAQHGYRVVGVDTSLDGVRAAREVARQLGVNVCYAVADARYLPFPESRFDVVFSYSVLQHFAKADTRETLLEIRRVLRSDGLACLQMLNSAGLRSTFNRLKRCGSEREFDVRYWDRDELLQTWTRLLGPTAIAADGFFSANVQPADLLLLPRRYRGVVRASEQLRKWCRRSPQLVNFADSLYLLSCSDGSRLQRVLEEIEQ